METNLTQLALAWAILSTANQQVCENVFGPYISGRYMKIAAVGAGIGVTFGAWQLASLIPELGSIASLEWGGVLALGFFVGTGSNLVHGLIAKYAPSANELPLLAMPKKNRLQEYTDKLNLIERAYQTGALTPEEATLKYKALRLDYPDQPDLRPKGFN